MPSRVQLKRSAGWRKPADAIVVARPSRWGNPFRIEYRPDQDGYVVAGPEATVGTFPDETSAARLAVDLFRTHAATLDASPLHGHDLACWCAPDQPCHADVLLELANPAVEQHDLFGGAYPDPEIPAEEQPPPGLGKDARVTWRRRRMIEQGIHPATKLPLAEHDPEAEPSPPTCGDCQHLWGKQARSFYGYKCDQAAAGGKDGPDMVKSWPACILWTPKGR